MSVHKITAEQLAEINRILSRTKAEEMFDERVSISSICGEQKESTAVRMAYFEVRKSGEEMTDNIKNEYRRHCIDRQK